MKRTILVILCVTLIPNLITAQLFKKIKDAAKKKIENEIEEKVVEAVAEELAYRAMKPINKAFEELLFKSFESQSGENLDSLLRESKESWGEFLGELNDAANVPDEYAFDYSLQIETEEQDKSKLKSEMLFSSSAEIIGMRQQDGGAMQLIVMDPTNDLMVLYNENEKTAQAIPTAFTFTKLVMSTAEESEDPFIKLTSTGKSKEIAGYQSNEFKGEDSTSEVKAYFTESLPFDWRDSFGQFIKSMAPAVYQENYVQIKGMMMRSESKAKKGGKKSKWEVKKVNQKNTQIKKAEYSFPSAGEK